MSEKFIILCDTNCDLGEDIRAQIGMTEYLSGHVHISDDRDIMTRLDWSEIGREEYYKTLSNKKLQVTTAPLSPEEYYQGFKKYAEEGYDIIFLALSSKISAIYNNTCTAAARIRKDFPERKVACVDTYKMSAALGLLAIYAYTMKQEGKSFDEIVAWLEENKGRVHQMGPIDDLIFIARRGRISMGKAIMGNFAGVKPMGDCSPDGYVSVLAKVKGVNKALDATVKYVEKMARDTENNYILVAHSDREAYAEKVKAMLSETLNAKQIFVTDVFAQSGANIGPGMVGVYFLGDKISEGLVAEKDCLTQIIG